MKHPQHYRAALLDPSLVEAYTATSDAIVNVAFADALIWLSNQMHEAPEMVTEQWLRERAVDTYTMASTDWRTEQEEEDDAGD